MHNIFYEIDMSPALLQTQWHSSNLFTRCHRYRPTNNCLSKLFITMEISSRNKAQVN